MLVVQPVRSVPSTPLDNAQSFFLMDAKLTQLGLGLSFVTLMFPDNERIRRCLSFARLRIVFLPNLIVDLSQVPWSKQHSLKHYNCNRSKQIFVKRVNRGKLGILQVHTGKIDSCWKLAKDFVPKNLATKKGKNKDLMKWLRCWQWRFENHADGLLHKTGKAVANLYA